jgi:predicted DNA-binding transcriptional regulator AlpA
MTQHVKNSPMAPELELAKHFLQLLDPKATAFTFKTLDDNQDRKSPSLNKDRNGARLVPMSKSTVYRMISAGTFQAPNKLGRRSVWSVQDIDSWRENWLEDEL